MITNQASPIRRTVVDGISIVRRLLSCAVDGIAELPEEVACHTHVFQA